MTFTELRERAYQAENKARAARIRANDLRTEMRRAENDADFATRAANAAKQVLLAKVFEALVERDRKAGG